MSQQQRKPVTLDYANASLTEEMDPVPLRVRLVLALTICISCVLAVFPTVYAVYFGWRHDLSWPEAEISVAMALAGLAGIVLAFRAASRECATSSTVLTAVYLVGAVGILATLVAHAVLDGVTGYPHPTYNPLFWIWLPCCMFVAAWILRGWTRELGAGIHGGSFRLK